MFRDTRKKKIRERLFFVALGLAVMAFGFWLNFRTPAQDEKVTSVDSKIQAEQTGTTDKHDISTDKDVQKSDDKDRETGTEKQYESYLIKEVNGVVKVFLCDDSGKKELYLITSIPFDLLSETDQKLFRNGVYVETKDDLGEFLENFDS